MKGLTHSRTLWLLKPAHILLRCHLFAEYTCTCRARTCWKLEENAPIVETKRERKQRLEDGSTSFACLSLSGLMQVGNAKT